MLHKILKGTLGHNNFNPSIEPNTPIRKCTKNTNKLIINQTNKPKIMKPKSINSFKIGRMCSQTYTLIVINKRKTLFIKKMFMLNL